MKDITMFNIIIKNSNENYNELPNTRIAANNITVSQIGKDLEKSELTIDFGNIKWYNSFKFFNS